MASIFAVPQRKCPDPRPEWWDLRVAVAKSCRRKNLIELFCWPLAIVLAFVAVWQLQWGSVWLIAGAISVEGYPGAFATPSSAFASANISGNVLSSASPRAAP